MVALQKEEIEVLNKVLYRLCKGDTETVEEGGGRREEVVVVVVVLRWM